MEVFESDDGLVTKYVHSDTSETAIKTVSSCDTIRNPVTGVLEMNPINRNKYSVFASISGGCPMQCDFCYLTMKEMPYKKLPITTVQSNLIDAIDHAVQHDASIASRYMKVCWMGMGEAILNPAGVYRATNDVLNYVTDNNYAAGLDGVDLSTVLPKIRNDDWIDIFHELNEDLKSFGTNPNNKVVVHSEAQSSMGNYIQRSPFRLFYSLHSAVQETRDQIIPGAMPLEEAMPKLLKYADNNKHNLIFHHMFMDGVNDSEEEVQALFDFITKWNLEDYEFRVLRYNRCDANEMEESDRFKEIIVQFAKFHNNLKIQISTGVEIQSACGQFITPFPNVKVVVEHV